MRQAEGVPTHLELTNHPSTLAKSKNVTLYDQAALDGTSIELTGENEDLHSNGRDNKERSIRIDVVK